MPQSPSRTPDVIRRKAELTTLFTEAGYQIRDDACQLIIQKLPTGSAVFSKYKIPVDYYVPWGSGDPKRFRKKPEGQDVFTPLITWLKQQGIECTGGGDNDKAGPSMPSGDSILPHKAALLTHIVFDVRQVALDDLIETLKRKQKVIPEMPAIYRQRGPAIS